MSHIIGRGRYARETYPEAGNPGDLPNDILRWYGGETAASVPATVFGASRSPEENAWTSPFDQPTILNSGAFSLPNGGVVGQWSVKRVFTDVGGPMIGDADIALELLQSTDNGASWVPIAGGAPIIITFAPNEEDDKSVVVNRAAPAGSLISIRATYPANFDPQGLKDNLLFTAGVLGTL